MSEFWTRIKYGVVGVLSLGIFVALMLLGLSDKGPGPLAAGVIAILLVGYLVHNATLGHLSPRQDTILTAVVSLVGFGAVAWTVLVNGERVGRDDLVNWGILLAAVVVLAAWTYIPRRE